VTLLLGVGMDGSMWRRRWHLGEASNHLTGFPLISLEGVDATLSFDKNT